MRTSVSLGRFFLVLLVFLSVVLAVLLHSHIAADDAAITFRYVDRAASGKGWTYNDHERVQGFSNPFYTALLSLLRLAGLDVETAAWFLQLLLYAAVVCLSYLLASRLAGPWGGLLAGTGLLASGFFRYQALDGMEASLSAFLGLGAIFFMGMDAPGTSGVLLGLALVNKLDAGFLALAIGAAYLLAFRKIPWKTMLVSGATALPWFVFAQAYYGSVLPNSMLVKMNLHAHGSLDRTWIMRILLENHGVLLLFPLLTAVLAGRRWAAHRKFTLLASLIWLAAHGTAFSLVDLGDAYPWYATVLFPPLMALCGAGASALWRFTSWRSGYGWLVSAAVLFAFVIPTVETGYRTTFPDLAAGNPIHPWEAFDLDRRLAGVFLDSFAGKDEIVSSAFGWVAYESRRPFNDTSLLNTIHTLEPAAYVVNHGVPYTEGSSAPAAPAGYVPLATFDLAGSLFPGYSWFTVFGRPDSSIARKGIRFLERRMHDFPPMEALGSFPGAEIHLREEAIEAHPPSGIVFRFPTLEIAPAWFIVQPGFSPALPEGGSDGVTFEIRINGATRFRSHLTPAHETDWVVLPLPENTPVAVGLITEPGPSGNTNFDWAWWWSPHLQLGEGSIDPARIRDAALRAAWCQRNPCGAVLRSSSAGRLRRAAPAPSPRGRRRASARESPGWLPREDAPGPRE